MQDNGNLIRIIDISTNNYVKSYIGHVIVCGKDYALVKVDGIKDPIRYSLKHYRVEVNFDKKAIEEYRCKDLV